MKSDHEAAAAVACIFLGEGQYCLHDEKNVQACPFFMFGGDPDKWLTEKFGHDLTWHVENCKAEIIDALESVLIGSRQARREFEEAAGLMTPENAKVFRENRHDQRRSSMNNIGKRAQALAKALRERMAACESTKS